MTISKLFAPELLSKDTATSTVFGRAPHLICDGVGAPLVMILTDGNHHDITQLLPLVKAI